MPFAIVVKTGKKTIFHFIPIIRNTHLLHPFHKEACGNLNSQKFINNKTCTTVTSIESTKPLVHKLNNKLSRIGVIVEFLTVKHYQFLYHNQNNRNSNHTIRNCGKTSQKNYRREDIRPFS